MKANKPIGKTMASIIALAMILSLIPMSPTVAAEEGSLQIDDGGDYTTVADFQSALQTQLDDDGVTKVTVTGELSGIDQVLRMDIPDGKQVIWKAKYTTTTGFGEDSLISFTGSGEFVVAEESIIEAARDAIRSHDEEAKITVEGGSVSVSGGSAIAAWGTGSAITINGGIVNSEGWAAIYSSGEGTKIQVNDGKVSALDGYVAIQALISDACEIEITGGTVISNGSYTIFASGEKTSIKVSGGTISAVNKCPEAIHTFGDNVTIEVSGGMVSSEIGNAIKATGNSAEVAISGGTIFGCGAGVNDVIHTKSPSNLTEPSNDAIIVGWDRAKSRSEYKDGTDIDIFALPETATAHWDIFEDDNGITYENASNTGFIKVPSVRILIPGEISKSNIIYLPIAAIDEDVEDIKDEIEEYLGAYATVTVKGSREDVNKTLELNIPNGRKVVWQVDYIAADNFKENLISLTGSGIFEVATGGKLEITSSGNEPNETGYALYSAAEPSKIIVSGGTVTSEEGVAIYTHGKSASITVNGGTITSHSGASALFAHGASAQITINGGTIISEEKSAISAVGESATVTVSGGTIFGTGSNKSDVIFLSENPQGFTDPTGNGLIIAWDQDNGTDQYTRGTRADIANWPAVATVTWDLSQDQHGILYANGINKGFIEVKGITVVHSAEVGGTVDVTGKTVEQVKTDIVESLAAHHAVTVTGRNTTMAESLKIHIPEGKKVIWKAEYIQTNTSIELLISLTGSGTFEIADGGKIDGDCFLLEAESDNSKIIVNGGTMISRGIGAALDTRGNYAEITVNSGTIITEGLGDALYSFGNYSKITINGGTIISEGFFSAIQAHGKDSIIEINGGLVAGSNALVAEVPMIKINGGVLFGQASNPMEIIKSNGFTGAIGNALLIAWDAKTDVDYHQYTQGTDTDIYKTHENATVIWDIHNGQYGISYTYGKIKGFIPIDRLTVGDTITYRVEFGVTGGEGSLTAMLDGISFPSGFKVPEGKSVTFHAVPKDGYRIQQWIHANQIVNGTNTSYTIADINENNYVYVVFERIPTYEVRVIQGGGQGYYAEDALVTLTADTAPEGKRFEKWTISPAVVFVNDKNETSQVAQFNMIGQDVVATAEYEDLPASEFAIHISTDGNGTAGAGTAFVTQDVNSAASGEEITLTAQANDGYKFLEWQVVSGDIILSNTTDNPATFTMPENSVALKATFEAIPPAKAPIYTITLDANGGTVTPEDMETEEDGTLSHLPTPTRGSKFTFDGWFSQKTLGIPITEDTRFADHVTIYALWTYIGGGSSSGGGSGSNTTPNDVAKEKPADQEDAQTSSGSWENPFDDVNSSGWYLEDVKYVYEGGLMSGTSTDPMMFSPDLNITRGMIATILYRHAGSPQITDAANAFSDVAAGQWYSDAVSWAAANGIAGGYGNDLFGTNDKITRQDLTVMLMRYADLSGMTLPAARDYGDFSDNGDIAAYAKNAVEKCYCGGVINGRPDNTFDPLGLATRAEAAAMLHRFLEAVKYS